MSGRVAKISSRNLVSPASREITRSAVFMTGVYKRACGSAPRRALPLLVHAVHCNAGVRVDDPRLLSVWAQQIIFCSRHRSASALKLSAIARLSTRVQAEV